MEHRVINAEPFQTREDGNGSRHLEGYFSVFDEPYEVLPGWIETIAQGAFTDTLRNDEDVKVLWNHNPDVVLGSTANKTAYLCQDERGLFGGAIINEEDQAAKDGYARVNRGDVRGCSFGFDILGQEESWDDDGTYRTKLTKIRLYEVSPCTFPAYQQTSILARAKQELEEAKAKLSEKKTRKTEQWRKEMKKRLKGADNGT